MKKNLKQKNKLFSSILCLSILLTLVFTGVESFAVGSTSPVGGVPNPALVESPAVKPAVNKPLDQVDSIPEKNIETLKKVEEHGIQNGFVKFLLAMLGVIVSSLAIFAGLKFYKFVVLKKSNSKDSIDYESSFDSPKNFKEAINLFLNKSDK